jgi:hypothetical protein
MIATLKKKAQRVKESITSQDRTDADLKIGIAGFYDRSSKLWEGMCSSSQKSLIRC